ncbi:MAG TPA: co-chaperone DjlA [Gammaproteobacteria bacterium]|nr:co-chaperone DjlA [Gammaproteobacteria bacterium]
MSWWGKVLGGAFGWMLGGPLGALIGAALGHNLDRKVDSLGLGGFAPGEQQRVQTAFFTALFSVMGHVAKADGRVSEDEIQIAKAMMDRLGLNEEMRQAAIRLFNEGKRADFPLDEVLDQFKTEVRRRRNLERMFLELLLQAALADGRMDPAERRLLLRVSQRLGFSAAEFEQLEAMIGAARGFGSRARASRTDTLAEAYKVLSVSPEASDAEVKKAYRRLMSQHHPDKLVAKGLPEEMMKVAAERTHEIRTAYERIREARGF